MANARCKYGGLVVLVFYLFAYNPLEAATLEVGPSGYKYSSVTAAINAAVSGVDEVLVHDGIYLERIDFRGKAISVRSVNGPDVTIIDGDKKGSVVTFNSGEEGDSLLEGFTIRNGHASRGGGIFCDNSSPAIINCNISRNYASRGGGGIYCRYSPWPMTIINCTISDNTSFDGGGIFLNIHSSSVIINCTVSGNSALGEGGGVYYNNASSSSITDSTVSGNSAGKWGGGIYCWSSSISISNSTISNNTAKIWGGGICLWSYSSPIITNCIISGNSAMGRGGLAGGGGIYCLAGSSPAITNCTIADNSAFNGPGIYCRDFSSPSIANTIIRDSIYTVAGSDPQSSYSNIVGGYPGLGNIDADPLFVDSGGADYHISAGSPSIDSGHPRIYDTDNSRSDMGVYGGGGGSDPIDITVAADGAGDYASIEDAVTYAVSGDIITVHPGTYTENPVIIGKDISLISRDGPASTIIDGSGSGSVITLINVGPDAVLQGFTIRSGSAVYGGGIHCISSSPEIKNCIVIGNTADNFGGGIYCRDDSSPIISDCIISGNSANNSGGGVYCFYSSPQIINCTISGNSAGRYGGGFYCTWYSSPMVVDSALFGDTATIGDDEVHLGLVASITITDSGDLDDNTQVILSE